MSASLGAADPMLMAPDYADPGEAIQVSIHGPLLDDVSVSLFNHHGDAVSRAEGFIWTDPEGGMVKVALLGIPSTAPPGRYTITLQAREGQALWDLEKPLIIRKKIYPEKVIKLNGKMNSLYTDGAERKKREARALWAVLNKFNPDALYHAGTFVQPVGEGVVTSDFGERRLYRMLDGSETSSTHFGQDLWNEPGTRILAAGKGRIVMAADRYLTGKTVILEHLPGVYTLYYHLDSISVRLGEVVFQGAAIGILGQSGFATGEHLHWELRTGGIPVSPSRFLFRPLLDTNSLYQ